MIDHIEIQVRDQSTSSEFYRRALAPLGFRLHVTGPSNGFGDDKAPPVFWVREGGPAVPPPHYAFKCETRELVERAYRAAIDAGGTDNGAPAVLERIHPHYFAGFVRDPDGHNVEFVCQAAPA